MDRWNHARELFDEHFRPLREAGFELERLYDAPTYWKLHEAEMRAHVPPEVFFELYALRTADEKAKQAQMAAIRYELRCGLATLTPRLRAHGFGAFATLKDQISGA
jgi:hypothetical protein